MEKNLNIFYCFQQLSMNYYRRVFFAIFIESYNNWEIKD